MLKGSLTFLMAIMVFALVQMFLPKVLDIPSWAHLAIGLLAAGAIVKGGGK